MIDKINNNHYDFDEWVDFEMDEGADMVERDNKFLEMKLGTDKTNSFFPILKFLDKNANKYDDHWSKADNEYSYSYINKYLYLVIGQV